MQNIRYYLGGFLFDESESTKKQKKFISESPFKESQSHMHSYEVSKVDTIQDQEDFKQNKQNLFSLTPRKLEVDNESPKFGKSNKKKQKKKEQQPYGKFIEIKKNHQKQEVQTYTLEEIQKNIKNKKMWVVHGSKVYDIGVFINYHPGGYEILQSMIGKDITNVFNDVHEWVNISDVLGNYQVGYIK